MEYFEVIFKNQSPRVKDLRSDYYDLDGKIAYKVVLEEERFRTVVMAKSQEAVENHFKEREIKEDTYTRRVCYDVKINYLRSEENQFETLFECDRVSTVEVNKRIGKVVQLVEYDHFCSEEVQERYSKADESMKEYMLKRRQTLDF